MQKQHPNDEIVKSLMDNMSYEIILIFPRTASTENFVVIKWQVYC